MIFKLKVLMNETTKFCFKSPYFMENVKLTAKIIFFLKNDRGADDIVYAAGLDTKRYSDNYIFL